MKLTTLVPLLLSCLFSGVSAQGIQISACTADQATEQTKLNNARSAWQRSAVNYYDYNWSEEYSGVNSAVYPYRVVVEVSTVQSINSQGQLVTTAMTIPQILDQIQSYLSDSTLRVYATYDANYGYPTMYQYMNSACGNVSTRRISDFDINSGNRLSAYNTNKALWQRKRWNNYDYSYQDYVQYKDAAWPLVVQVRNTLYASAQDHNNNQVLWASYNGQTINDFFALIKRQIDANVPYLEVNYAATDGYPTAIFYVTAGSTTIYAVEIFTCYAV
ncbi:expressed unknown protein [Seminavis robusta]|uniref:Uncharacterized protein n=1 Tax=Seminavis robusta TaxID=568900 RepID=A0A9N8HDH3_9STRA|nr:expressed unknown protein [Seminavis robusta]|eukprot:Sro360_g126330.1 n/a (274) ;mRNA; r:55460-56281